MQFGDRVRNLREDYPVRLTQKELATATNMTQRKLSRIERNEFEPSLQDIVELCLFFHVSADYLLGLPEGLLYPKR